MAEIDLVVIGASAGGLVALSDLVGSLPGTLDATILTVVHARAEGDSLLAPILARSSPLPVEFAIDGELLQRGKIFVAPRDLHLIVTRNTMHLGHGPKENGFRPAVDPLFRSAAKWHGNQVMGVVLSGALNDGTYGLQVIKQNGGTTVAQDPNEATHPGMPLSAIRHVDVDHVLPVLEIAKLIADRSSASTTGEQLMPRRLQEPEPQDAAAETDVQKMDDTFGPASGLTCPDCGGALWEIHNGELTRYRCHVGHQFTTEGLDDRQRDAVENALWSAVRMLEERADLRERMAQRAQDAGMEAVSSGFAESAVGSKQQAHTMRELLLGRALPSSPPPAHDKPNGRTRKSPKSKARRRRR
jgi:two-component system, chemotaxis family, protein-glutamate methylesterase/glutaminase